MVRGVTFDFGGTLVQGELAKEAFQQSLFHFLRSLGFSGGEAQLNKVRNGMLKKLAKARSLNREIRFEDLYRGLLFKIGLHPDNDVINHVFRLYIRAFRVELIPGAEQVLAALAGSYKLAVLSNAMSNLARYALTSLGIERFFESVVISRDLGIRKPDPQIFEFALSNLGLEKHEVVHVGDSYVDDVQGAKNAGITAVWIRRGVEEITVLPDYTINAITELPSILMT